MLETEVHILLHYPFAVQIWEGTSFERRFWDRNFRTMKDCVELAAVALDKELGAFVAVIWECWNARNRFIHQRPDRNLACLGVRATNFVKSYRDLKEKGTEKTTAHEVHWKPPTMVLMKLNFDRGQVGEDG